MSSERVGSAQELKPKPLEPTSPQGQDVLATRPVILKATLLVTFCFAQFLDAFNNSSFFAAIPPIAVDLNIGNGNSVWLISAYQLTFAALLLSVRFSVS